MSLPSLHGSPEGAIRQEENENWENVLLNPGSATKEVGVTMAFTFLSGM